MVTKLKDNSGYIKYIRKKMKLSLPTWKEVGVNYENQIHNNFQIDFEFLENRVSFVKDRELLELRMFSGEKPIRLGYLLYNSILDFVPEQDQKWRTTVCVELVDYYINFLKSFYIKN